jgi:hypothetical protein
MPFADRYDQLSQDVPTFRQPPQPYQWATPSHWQRTRLSGGGRAGVNWSDVFGSGRAARGGGAVSSAQQQDLLAPTAGDRFVARWRASEDRADRLRQRYEGTQDWSGSPTDYNDVIGPNRSGGLAKVTSGPPQTGLRRDEGWDPGSLSPVRPKPTNGNGDGLSGGVAQRIPTSVGGSW